MTFYYRPSRKVIFRSATLLDEVQYETKASGIARQLEISVSDLDLETARRRDQMAADNNSWPDPVDGARLLKELQIVINPRRPRRMDGDCHRSVGPVFSCSRRLSNFSDPIAYLADQTQWKNHDDQSSEKIGAETACDKQRKLSFRFPRHRAKQPDPPTRRP